MSIRILTKDVIAVFSVSAQAIAYIKKNGGNVVVLLEFMPAMGGCQCKGVRILGSYVPKLELGSPEHIKGNYKVEVHDGVKVHYPVNLKVKSSYENVQIALKSVVVAKWLEMEGAQGYSVKPEDE